MREARRLFFFWRTFCFWKWREDGPGGGGFALRLGEVGADVFSHQLLSMPTWRHNKIIHQLRLAASDRSRNAPFSNIRFSSSWRVLRCLSTGKSRLLAVFPNKNSNENKDCFCRKTCVNSRFGKERQIVAASESKSFPSGGFSCEEVFKSSAAFRFEGIHKKLTKI